ncbi:MAG: hypothetical protein C0507_05310 [Cyanobacteria bacterium PR.3.49]|nr:hypothetical protein [Cyanobacteria bacterium PR.3.49]
MQTKSRTITHSREGGLFTLVTIFAHKLDQIGPMGIMGLSETKSSKTDASGDSNRRPSNQK